MNAQMNLQMAGIDYTTAPVEIREKFALTSRVRAELMQRLTGGPDVLGTVMLSTCNRTEVWAHCPPGAQPDLAAALCEAAGVEKAAYADRFVHREGEDAVRYLFETASGLRSQVFGEDQILTQVKEALEQAREALCTDSVLEVLFRMAVTGGKKAKSGMQMSMANTSAVDCALHMLQRAGALSGKKCLVIGNGKMGRLAAEALRGAGADVTVTVRQYRSGVVEIPRGCRRVDYGARMALVPECDVVLSATASPNVTVKYDEVRALPLRTGVVFIDLAVPRDIDPRVGRLPGVQLYDIDSFSAQPPQQLEQARAQAQEVLRAQLAEFCTWYECRDMIPQVNALAQKFGRDTLERAEPAVRSLGLGGESAALLRGQLEDVAAKQFRKLLFAVRDEAGAGAFRECLGAMEKLYEQDVSAVH